MIANELSDIYGNRSENIRKVNCEYPTLNGQTVPVKASVSQSFSPVVSIIGFITDSASQKKQKSFINSDFCQYESMSFSVTGCVKGLR